MSQADSLTKNARQYMRRMAEVRVKDIKNKKYLLVFKYSLATYTQFYILDSCLNWGPIFSHVLIIDTFPHIILILGRVHSPWLTNYSMVE